jgi:hypothetical protein
MRKVYHASLEIVKNPRVIMPTRGLDFGMGFNQLPKI